MAESKREISDFILSICYEDVYSLALKTERENDELLFGGASLFYTKIRSYRTAAFLNSL